MVKGLSRGKFDVVFTRVNFTQVTCGYTCSYLPRLISVSTQLFSLETLEGLSERAGFSVLKTLDIQDKKNVTWMFQVEFLKIQNQVNKNIWCASE